MKTNLKTGKNPTMKFDGVKIRQLGTGIGQDQAGMKATGAYRMNCVTDQTPPKQKAVAPRSSVAKPAVPAGYCVDPTMVTGGEPEYL